jgi:cyclic di-GMP phosphodiesterase
MNAGRRIEKAHNPGEVAAIRRLYSEAIVNAGQLWEAAHAGPPDPRVAITLVDDLAQAVAQNRTAMVAVTQLKAHDESMSTHMVNVAILTMAQADMLGIEGALLREFGVAALMHDIGKVRTPIEILSKPDKLTDAEFAIMRMHVVDGAEILRATPELPALAPTVAFEHHLRLDGSGYPIGVMKALNLGTMLCSIADVHDAMRSHRAYQESFPTDRILEVLKRNAGLQFDRHLVERFTQLMGIYPPGDLVKLDTGELGVVVRVNPEDPYRPHVRVIAAANGERLPYDVNLSESRHEHDKPRNVVSAVDPTELGIDPLTYL